MAQLNMIQHRLNGFNVGRERPIQAVHDLH